MGNNIQPALKKYILEDFEVIANLQFQSDIWLNKNNPNKIISSYDEVIDNLFSTHHFESFIRYCEGNNICNSAVEPMRILHGLLVDHTKKYCDDDDIEKMIATDEWAKIRKIAGQVFLLISECKALE